MRPKKKGTSRRSSDLADLSRIVPIYAYRGVHANGRATKGSVTADSERTARSRMRAEGVFLTEITESQADSSRAAKSAGGSGGRFDFNFSRPIPSMERAIATRQLATLVGAGIPLVDSLTTLVQQIEHLVERLRTHVSKRRRFHVSLPSLPRLTGRSVRGWRGGRKLSAIKRRGGAGSSSGDPGPRDRFCRAESSNWPPGRCRRFS